MDPIKGLKNRLSEVRGLKFTAEVPIIFETTENLNARLDADLQADPGGSKREDRALAYAKLGLLPQGIELRGGFLNYYSSQAQGFYNSSTKKIVLLEGQDSPTTPNSAPGKEIDTRALVHELTHALQDQHFSLAAKLRPPANGDQILAIRSVAEADAVLSEYAYLFGGLEDWVPGHVLQLLENNAGESGSSVVPAVIADKMRFQYSDGLKFVSQFISNRGWPALNLLYTHPPLSTEQVLHPEKYFAAPDAPARITLTNVGSLLSAEWREVENDTLGELLVHCLFKQFLGPRGAAVGAGGWDGDRFVAYRRGDEVAFIWVTAWDSYADAQEFFDGYQSIVPMKYDSRLLERDRFYIEKRDQTVLVVEGFDRDDVKGLVDNAWRGMEVKKATFQPPPLHSLTRRR